MLKCQKVQTNMKVSRSRLSSSGKISKLSLGLLLNKSKQKNWQPRKLKEKKSSAYKRNVRELSIRNSM